MAQAAKGLEPGVVRISGAPEGFDASVIAGLAARAGGPVIFVARDAGRLEATRRALEFFAADLAVVRFPAWDCVPYDRVSPATEISAARMSVLAALSQGLRGPMVL
ncbi:MAG: hypothetical protein AAF245_16630, partial [Pseudomonadota bacterium]